MGDVNLRSELEQVTSELVAAKTEYASLGARIAGLEAQRAALLKAIPGPDDQGEGDSIAAKHRTDHIVEVLTATGAEMSANDVIAALHDTGRPYETYDNVSADLAYLAERGRIARMRRGVYAAIREPQADPDRIVIPLTQGNINNGHVYLARHLDFFPDDAIGGHNKQAGQGTPLKLQFEGFPETEPTDITSDKKSFRLRRPWPQFFERHGLRAGDKVAIERISTYEYRIAPVRSEQN